MGKILSCDKDLIQFQKLLSDRFVPDRMRTRLHRSRTVEDNHSADIKSLMFAVPFLEVLG